MPRRHVRARSRRSIARVLTRAATTEKQRAWWRREVMFLESVERVVTAPERAARRWRERCPKFA